MKTNKQIALRPLAGAFIDRDPGVVDGCFTARLYPAQSHNSEWSQFDQGADSKIAQRLFLPARHGVGRR